MQVFSTFVTSPNCRHLSSWEQGNSEPRKHGTWNPPDLEARSWGRRICSQGLPTLTLLIKAKSSVSCSRPPAPTEGAFGTGGSSRQPKAGTGPPDPSLDGPRAAVVIHCKEVHHHSGAVVPLQQWPGSPALPRQLQVCNPSRLLASPGHWSLAYSREGHPPISRALPSQPLVVTSAKGLSQRSHWRPMTPGLHGHWPSSGSQTRDREPVG